MANNIWHPYSRLSVLNQTPPPIIEKGSGIYLYDRSGKRYMDAISSWWCAPLGHSHPRLTSAIVQQTEKLQHSILGNLSNAPAEKLSDMLADSMPDKEVHVMFASDGASAVEASLKVAMQYYTNRGISGKDSFFSLKGDYHGDTLGAVSVGFVPGFHEPFSSFTSDRCFTVDLPDYSDGAEKGFAPTKEILVSNADKICAAIVEPLCQGASGMRMYPPEYLKDLSEACRELDILLIVDEIAMGFGRTGSYWAFEQAGQAGQVEIIPDIVCVGKALTGGYLPLSAMICRDSIYQTFSDLGEKDNTFYHGHTFAGNPIACACAAEAMAVYDEMDVAEVSAGIGSQMKEHLLPLKEKQGVLDARFLGSIAAIELKDMDACQSIYKDLLSKGYLVRPLGNVIYLMPPLIIKNAELTELCKDLYLSVINNI